MVGLYGSTYGIDLAMARTHWKLIASAVSLGVVLKSALIGGVMVLVTGHMAYALLGVVVAQIDPLSTAAILGSKHMSTRVKTILGAWASFDDPVTVILVIYLTPFISKHAAAGDNATRLLGQYGVVFAENLAFAGAIFITWRLFRRSSKATYGLLPTALVAAVVTNWALGIAAIGLFLRPSIDKLVDFAVKIALWAATILLGILLVGGVQPLFGIILGISAFGAHILVSWLLTGHLPKRDRIHLAFAQQNGITAIILALLLEPKLPGTVAIVAPAILVTNTLHAFSNKVLAAHSQKATWQESWPV